jgi:hypothetical protein
MRTRLHYSLLAFALALTAALASPPPALAADPVAIRWEQLIPASHQEATSARELMAKFLAPKQTTGRAALSVSRRADLVEAYDGARVRITGFAVPFNNEEPPFRRLLLIPFSGACVKFPPPRNQAILVNIDQGITLSLTDFVYPVVVTGQMSVTPAETDIARTGYTISAETIVPAD